MNAQAERDGDIFLPNPTPSGPVDFVLVCMEPSLGRWAATPKLAYERIAAGFRNFIFSLEDFILHYCASQYLCDKGQSYFVTDVSKGAMLVNRANKERTIRYDRWHDLLIEELDLLLRPPGRVIAVGNSVAKHFQIRRFRDFSVIMHYSNQAAAGRNAAIFGHEQEFKEFRNSVTLRDVIENSEQYMLAHRIPVDIRAETVNRLAATKLTESRQKLIFIYKIAFESMQKPTCDVIL